MIWLHLVIGLPLVAAMRKEMIHKFHSYVSLKVNSLDLRKNIWERLIACWRWLVLAVFLSCSGIFVACCKKQ